MLAKEPSRCGQVIQGGQPVVNECELIGLQSASGRAFSPTQDLRFYLSRLAMRAVRRPDHRSVPAWVGGTEPPGPPARCPTAPPTCGGNNRRRSPRSPSGGRWRPRRGRACTPSVQPPEPPPAAAPVARTQRLSCQLGVAARSDQKITLPP